MFGIIQKEIPQTIKKMYRWIFTFPNPITGNELVISIIADDINNAIQYVKDLSVVDKVKREHLTYVEEIEGDVIYEEDIPEDV